VKVSDQAAFISDSWGKDMHRFIAELYPICRSITGQGIRETFRHIQRHIPLTTFEVPSGTQVFDWTVPLEWNIQDAYVADRQGVRVVDFKQSNLHVVSYSVPIRARMPLRELREHLFTLPDHPEWIPYRTSYYKESWGFCLSHRQYQELHEDEYDVVIDSSLKEGHLTYGEYYLPGETSDEVLISCHACHPSLCNDNLSGIAVATFLAKALQIKSHRYSYRFLFLPVTIGAITWLALNRQQVSKIKHGFVMTGVGDEGSFTYKRTRRGNADIDAVFTHVLQHSGEAYEVSDFIPYGYDERQYGSPGFNLPVGCFMRRANGRYPEYHTSADNLDFVKPASLERSLEMIHSVVEVLESNRSYVNTAPYCEPQLGKRGLYRTIGGTITGRSAEMALLWVLNLSDGTHTLLQIAEQARLPFSTIKVAADALTGQGLLLPVGDSA
jgi:aminopeptidase-like protein